ncbi:hypothetical protein L1987_18447 [Smallanthus sonchifolius]|uniref:Uncharacterized protein n=1 Tax=Smallanthus sonchifolius TaxID=185202 RepID=A0ACB9J1U4_9ASTR|nr:hypothetical protein L1987_18447 [Smallanthus sonchifolius]
MAGMAPQKPCPPLTFKPLLSTINNNTMKELAKQELKLLEAQHPTRFQNLKLQLKVFIRRRRAAAVLSIHQSSSSRKRQREGEKDDGCKMRRGEGMLFTGLKLVSIRFKP